MRVRPSRGVLDRHGRSEAYHVGIPRGVRDIYSATVAGVPIRIVMARSASRTAASANRYNRNVDRCAATSAQMKSEMARTRLSPRTSTCVTIQ
jgi:hypothetical protein